MKKFAKNEGTFTDSVVPITTGTERTDQIVVTESFLDGVSFGIIEGFPENQAIYSTAGARVPHEIISHCKKEGLELHMALDNDIAGRRVTAETMRECKKHEVPCTYSLPENGTIEVSLDPENPISRDFYRRIQKHLEKEGKPTDWSIDQENSEASILMENTRGACRLLHEMQPEVSRDKLARERELNKEKYPNGIPKGAKDAVRARKAMERTFHNKDWNDELKRQIRMEMEQPVAET